MIDPESCASTVLGKNKSMTLIFLTNRRNANFEDIFRVQVNDMPNNLSLEKKTSPSSIGAYRQHRRNFYHPKYTLICIQGRFSKYFFPKKHDIAEQGPPKVAKSMERCAVLQMFFMIFILMITQMAHSISDNFKNREICREILKVKCVK